MSAPLRIAVIGTGNFGTFHAKTLAAQAAKAGLHVLVEKPLANSAAEIQSFLCRRTGRYVLGKSLLGGWPDRHFPKSYDAPRGLAFRRLGQP